MNSLITVGVSTHGKRRKWLQDAIDSMYYLNNDILFDLIVVDNASEDDTSKYLYQLKTKKNLSIISNSENFDDTIAMNQILAMVLSKYFLKVDSDVIFFEHRCISESILRLEQLGVSLIGPYWDLSLTRKEELFNWPGYKKSKALIKECMDLVQCVNPHFDVTMRLPRGNFILMKTSDIASIGGFDEIYKHNAMEYPLIMRLLESGLDYSEYSNAGIIHKPSDEQRLLMRKIVPYTF